MGNQEIELQKEGNRTWTLAQRPYVPCFLTTYTHSRLCMCREISPISEIRTEVQRITGNLFWAKSRQANDAIDLQDLFDNYWSSNKHEFTVPSQS